MGQLNRSMRFRDMVILGLLFMSPAAPVGLYGVLDATSDGAVALVYLVATFAMSFTAIAYARMSNELPNAGAVYAYCSAGLHPKVGFLVGWLLLLDYMFIPAVAYLFSGISLNVMFPSIPVWVWTSIAVVVTTILNLIGVKKSVKVTFFILIVEIVVIGLVMIAGLIALFQYGPQREISSIFVGEEFFSWQTLFTAVSMAVLSYLGFDAIATFSEENTGGKSLVSKAIIVCLVLAGVLFILQTSIIALLNPHSPEYLREHPELQGRIFYQVVNEELAVWIGTGLSLMKGIGSAFAAMVAQAAASRLLFSMGRDRQLPHQLSKVGKTGVPTVAILFTAFFTLILAAVAANSHQGLPLLVSFVDVGAIVAFIMLNIAVIGYFRFKKNIKGVPSIVLDIIIPLIGVAVLLPVLFNMNNAAKIVGVCWLVVGIVIMILNKKNVDVQWLKQ